MATLKTHLANLPDGLATALGVEFSKLRDRFAKQDWEPGQLNGGKFAEAVFRVVEWHDTGSFTPLGSQIDRTKIVNSVQHNTSLSDSLRLQIPQIASTIADVRNKRDVGHLSGDVEVNGMDAQLVMASASWLLAEIVRLETGSSPEEAQELIDGLVERRVPIIEEIDGSPVVLNTDLPAMDRAFISLYKRHPNRIPVRTLAEWISYKNESRFRKLLEAQERIAMVNMNGQGVRLTIKGVGHVERNINLSMEL